MGFRFTRRIKVAPGISLNLGKRGGSLSFGPKGAKLTVGTSGVRATAGIPGTGLYYTQKLDAKTKARQTSSHRQAQFETVSPQSRLQLGFFQRLLLSKEEQAWVDGCREMSLGNNASAIRYLQQAGAHADAAFLLATLTSMEKRFEEARNHLLQASNRKEQLGTYFNKYGVQAETSFSVTDELHVSIAPNLQGVLFMLVEMYQQLKMPQEALAILNRLRQMDPNDVVVKLSYVELLTEEYFDHKQYLHQVLQLAEGIENESDIHTGILYYKGKALRGLGLLEAARETLTLALRRKKDRPDELLLSIQYERALVHEAMGKASEARSDFEKIYAKSPDFEDVAERLGLPKMKAAEGPSTRPAFSRLSEERQAKEASSKSAGRYRTIGSIPSTNPSVISWIVSILSLLIGVGKIDETSGWVFLGMGLLLLPPLTRKIEKFGYFQMTKNMKIGVVILGLLLAGALAPDAENSIPSKQAQSSSDTSISHETSKAPDSVEARPELLPPPALPEGVPELAKGVVIRFNVDVREDKTAHVSGETNLPDSTELMISIESKSSRRYKAQDKAKVSGYRFSAGPFSMGNGPLPDGVYKIEVLMPVSDAQPESVKTIIGQNGKKLKGKLVKKSHLGVTVEKAGEFFVGADKATAAQAETQSVKALRIEADEIYQQLMKYLKLGKEMERIRQSHDLNDLQQCGEKMQQYKLPAQELGNRSEKLPNHDPYYTHLRIAAVNMTLCVTCSPGLAMDNCKMAEEELRQVKAAKNLKNHTGNTWGELD